MLKRLLGSTGALAIAAALLGCNDAGRTTSTTRTTTTTRQEAPAPAANDRVQVDAGPNGGSATGTVANGRDGVDVDVNPGGGVDVGVEGEPIRDRIRERRAQRAAGVPR